MTFHSKAAIDEVYSMFNQPPRHETARNDSDEEDDDYDYDAPTQAKMAVSPDASTVVKGTMKAGTVQVQSELPASTTARDRGYKEKYGQSGMNGTAASGWDPLQATPKQRMWMQRGFTFMAAFMLASLCYSIVAQLPFLVHTPPLWPNPWFVLVLSGTQAETLGLRDDRNARPSRSNSRSWRSAMNLISSGSFRPPASAKHLRMPSIAVAQAWVVYSLP